jgi:hypothetical protein
MEELSEVLTPTPVRKQAVALPQGLQFGYQVGSGTRYSMGKEETLLRVLL